MRKMVSWDDLENSVRMFRCQCGATCERPLESLPEDCGNCGAVLLGQEMKVVRKPKNQSAT